MQIFSKKRAQKVLDNGASDVTESDIDVALSNRQRIINKVLQNASLAPYIGQVKTLFSLLQDYVKGDYREIPWWSLGSVVTALLYILLPLDAVPDIIPIAGFLDDAVVLKLCLDLVSKDLENYKLNKVASTHDESDATS
ncbi:YkvA family protein [Zhongshania sp. BJYM1]|uniref:YkvA family protein n=1 Tax=Zhongshania aquatica TaxID=2965069 RepID=UPI0022B3CF76|nr:YkvA family protein [Marortus sp. BJYM1]